MLPEKLAAEAKKRIAPYRCEGFLDGENPTSPELFFIGEAPGETEIYKGDPFGGRAGRQFLQYIQYLGFSIEEVYVTRTIKSRPYTVKEKNGEKRKYNRTPSKKEILAHAPLLDYEISSADPAVLLPMGKTPYWRLLGKSPAMSETAGHMIRSPIRQYSEESGGYVWSEKEYSIFPLYHPAASLYNRSLDQTIYAHLDKLKNAIASGTF